VLRALQALPLVRLVLLLLLLLFPLELQLGQDAVLEQNHLSGPTRALWELAWRAQWGARSLLRRRRALRERQRLVQLRLRQQWGRQQQLLLLLRVVPWQLAWAQQRPL